MTQSFRAFWSLETFDNSSDTSQVLIWGIGWMVGGIGVSGNIIRANRAWTEETAWWRGKGGECFTSVEG